MNIYIITLFPEMFDGPFSHSMLLKAQKLGLAKINIVNLRDYGIGERKTVDDTPYGGGDGMVLRPEPIFDAVESIKNKDPNAKVILTTPRGRTYNQALAKELSANESLIIVCGRYEGFDERVSSIADYQISIGDYVLTGGEIPAMAIVDSIVRLIPGVLGGETSAEIESFSDGKTVEYPQYTRPREYKGLRVPDVLLSGNHQEIEKWRKAEQKKATKLKHQQDNKSTKN